MVTKLSLKFCLFTSQEIKIENNNKRKIMNSGRCQCIANRGKRQKTQEDQDEGKMLVCDVTISGSIKYQEPIKSRSQISQQLLSPQTGRSFHTFKFDQMKSRDKSYWRSDQWPRWTLVAAILVASSIVPSTSAWNTDRQQQLVNGMKFKPVQKLSTATHHIIKPPTIGIDNGLLLTPFGGHNFRTQTQRKKSTTQDLDQQRSERNFSINTGATLRSDNNTESSKLPQPTADNDTESSVKISGNSSARFDVSRSGSPEASNRFNMTNNSSGLVDVSSKLPARLKSGTRSRDVSRASIEQMSTSLEQDTTDDGSFGPEVVETPGLDRVASQPTQQPSSAPTMPVDHPMGGFQIQPTPEQPQKFPHHQRIHQHNQHQHHHHHHLQQNEHSFAGPIEAINGGDGGHFGAEQGYYRQEGRQLADDHNSGYSSRLGNSLGSASEHIQVPLEKSPSQIKVVFNNNPQFLIGRDTSQLPGLADSFSVLQQRNRRPHSSSAHQADEYHSDESKLDETKVSLAKALAPNDVIEPPCAKDRASKVIPNAEQMSMQDQQQQQQPVFDEQQEKLPVSPPLAVPKTPQLPQPNPPLNKSKPPPEIGAQQQKQLDEQVNTPFEEIVKSGLRPPLRMVISMRNKNGDTTKVPIILHGNGNKKASTFDFGPQMQIHFEPQDMIQQIDEQRKQLDDDTPIGGDIFDPSLATAFNKGKSKIHPIEQKLTPPPLVPVPVPVPEPKTAPLPPAPPIIPPQQQQVVVDSEPLPPAKVPIRPRTQVSDVNKPELPPIKEPPQQQVVQEPQIKEEQPAIKEPQRPIEPINPPPPLEQQPQVKEEQIPSREPPTKGVHQVKEEVPQIIVDMPQIKEEPPIRQVPAKGPDCRDHQHKDHSNVDGERKDHQLDPSEGLLQMMMPTMAAFHNITFVSMFAQFQKALGEQMSMQEHKVNSPPGHGPKALDNLPPVYEQHQLQQPQQQQQQHQPLTRQDQDEQEDLMVAMMAANMSGHPDPLGEKQVSMTVIKPPKGTSLQDVIRAHADPSMGDPSRTVAILHSIRAKANRPQFNINMPNQQQQQQQQPEMMVSPKHLPFQVAVQLKQGGNPNPTPLQPPESDSESDPDGFTSGSHIQFSHRQRRKPDEHGHLSREIKVRFKRSVGGDYYAGFYGGSQLEPTDKLAYRGNRFNQFKHAPTSSAGDRYLAPTRRRDMQASRRADEGRRRPAAVGPNWWAAKNHRKQPAEGKDVFLGSASEQNEVMQDETNDDSEDEADAGDDSSSADHAAASAPHSSETTESDDYGGDLGDDSSDESASFDSDDEPYNLGASSKRDYGSPTSFEIPQIDINPDTLKQKGCRTVLREVQEIPMNGLGAVQANGKPGSGYGSRHKRHTSSNDNLINSRKVTSIVMTKECHFPNEIGVGTETGKPNQDRRYLAVNNQQDSRGSQASSSRQHMQQIIPMALESANKPYHRLQQPPMSSNVFQHPKQQQPQRQQQQQKPGQLPQSSNFPTPNAGIKGGNNMNYDSIRQIPQAKQNQMGAIAQRPQYAPVVQHPSNQLVSGYHQPTSQIKRRSVGSPPAPPAPVAAKPSTSSHNVPALYAEPKPRFVSNRDIYMGADSKRNEVIAKKLYKPPSDEDPYHTLSYSSKDGADPDMDQDEDDSVMEADETSSGRHDRQRANRRPATASAQRNKLSAASRGRLPESERRALLDPNHEDTDPVGEHGGSGQDLNEEPSNQAMDADDQEEGEPEEQPTMKRKSPDHQGPHRGRGSAAAVARSGRRAHEDGRRRPSETHRKHYEEPSARRPTGPKFGKSFKYEHESSRPKSRGLATQLSRLEPGRQEFVNSAGADEAPPSARRAALSVPSSSSSRVSQRRNADLEDETDDEDADDGASTSNRPQRVRGGQHAAAAAAASDAADEEPDMDPDYNPKEGRVPAHTKPKKVEKSFAYVHRDLPRKGAKNPDDFVVSYGRGNFQTEHEDYDSDREVPLKTSVGNSNEDPKDQEASVRQTNVMSPNLPQPSFKQSQPKWDQQQQMALWQLSKDQNAAIMQRQLPASSIDELRAAMRVARARRNLPNYQVFV